MEPATSASKRKRDKTPDPFDPVALSTRASPSGPSQLPVHACKICRDAHSACDTERPCRRCVRLGRANLCTDLPLRRRSRRAAFYAPLASGPATGEGPPTNSPGQLVATSITPGGESNQSNFDGLAQNNSNHRVHILTQLVHSMNGRMQVLEHINEELRAEVGRLQMKQSELDEVLFRKGDRFTRIDSSRPVIDTAKNPNLFSPPQVQLPASYFPTSASAYDRQTSFADELSLLKSGVGPGVILEARRQMPWLCQYDISPTRFPIPDLSYPVCAFQKMATLELPSRLCYANSSFVHLSKYTYPELVGMPFSAVWTGHERLVSVWGSMLYNQPPLSSSEIFSYGPLLRCKDNQLLRATDDRDQFYYDITGNGLYVIICMLKWEPGEIRETEGFDRWVPLRPLLPPAPPAGE